MKNKREILKEIGRMLNSIGMEKQAKEYIELAKKEIELPKTLDDCIKILGNDDKMVQSLKAYLEISSVEYTFINFSDPRVKAFLELQIIAKAINKAANIGLLKPNWHYPWFTKSDNATISFDGVLFGGVHNQIDSSYYGLPTAFASYDLAKYAAITFESYYKDYFNAIKFYSMCNYE